MSKVSVIEQKMEAVNLNGAPLGKLPLAGKLKRSPIPGETPVEIYTNLIKMFLKANVPIYKYAVEIKLIFEGREKEGVKEISKSRGKGAKHEYDKTVCSKVYRMACRQCPELQKGGPFFYDRQGCLYSFTQLASEEVKVALVGADICRRPGFIRSDFKVTKVAESFQVSSNDINRTYDLRPAQIDRTLHEVLNLLVSGGVFENPEVLTIGNCIHYLKCNRGLNIPDVNGPGLREQHLGATKSVKTLEGKDEKAKAAFYLAAELKATLFHPSEVNLVKVFSSFKQFAPTLAANTAWAKKVVTAFKGLYCFQNYGPCGNLGDDRDMVEIRGFGETARRQTFQTNDGPVSVFEYFKNKYGKTLAYPDLFTILAKGRNGKAINIPAELLSFCPNQVVTTEQMEEKQQADLILMSAKAPASRKELTDKIVTALKLGTDKTGLMKLSAENETVRGAILPHPTIVCDVNGRQKAYWGKQGGTSFSFNRYYMPKNLNIWAVVCTKDRPAPMDSLKAMVQDMEGLGMKVAKPNFMYIENDDLRSIFERAKPHNPQLLMFITEEFHHYHKEIKALEQEYDILTQDLKYLTAQKMERQGQTRKNIINKLNIKLGGLNYAVEDRDNKKKLFVGFEISQKGGGGDAPIAIGYSANSGDHTLKYNGGYVYGRKTGDNYGPIIEEVLTRVFKEALNNRKEKGTNAQYPTAFDHIYCFFSGVTEGQYSRINETFMESIKKTWVACRRDNSRPHITLLAVSKIHNIRLYQKKEGKLLNIVPGTVVDKGIVSPVLTEFYLAGAEARQGTVKTAKYTLVSTSQPGQDLSELETLTYNLCFNHQIIGSPVSLPAPLYLAGEYSKRGAAVLALHGPVLTNGEVDMVATNKAYGYVEKKLSGTRFNA